LRSAVGWDLLVGEARGDNARDLRGRARPAVARGARARARAGRAQEAGVRVQQHRQHLRGADGVSAGSVCAELIQKYLTFCCDIAGSKRTATAQAAIAQRQRASGRGRARLGTHL
jgi:hypothetical protein